MQLSNMSSRPNALCCVVAGVMLLAFLCESPAIAQPNQGPPVRLTNKAKSGISVIFECLTHQGQVNFGANERAIVIADGWETERKLPHEGTFRVWIKNANGGEVFKDDYKITYKKPLDLAIEARDVMEMKTDENGRKKPVKRRVLVVIPQTRGQQVTEVAKGGPAQTANLREGDVIISVGTIRTATFEELQRALAAGRGEVEIVVMRKKEEVKLLVSPVDGKIGVTVKPRVFQSDDIMDED